MTTSCHKSLKPACLMALILSAIVSGCTPSRPHYLREPGELHVTYVDSQIQIEYPDVQTESLDEVTKTKSPITLSKPDFDKPWDLTLQEAVQTALRNSAKSSETWEVSLLSGLQMDYPDGLPERRLSTIPLFLKQIRVQVCWLH